MNWLTLLSFGLQIANMDTISTAIFSLLNITMWVKPSLTALIAMLTTHSWCIDGSAWGEDTTTTKRTAAIKMDPEVLMEKIARHTDR